MDNQINMLNKNDSIAFILPSGNVDDGVINENKEFFAHYVSKIDDFCYRGDDSFSAASDELRTKGFLDAISSKSKILWPLRGGYGSTRLLNQIKNMPKPHDMKYLMGFSDVTALQLFINKFWGWPYFSAPPYNFVKNENPKQLYDELFDVLNGNKKKMEYQLVGLNSYAEREVNVIGEVLGGNLSILQCSLGSFWQPNLTNKILFFEDWHEQGYKLDRMLNHLYQSEILSKIKAVIVGDIGKTNDSDGKDRTNIAIKRFAESLKVPVFHLPNLGHSAQTWFLPMGFVAKIDCKTKKLEYKFS